MSVQLLKPTLPYHVTEVAEKARDLIGADGGTAAVVLALGGVYAHEFGNTPDAHEQWVRILFRMPQTMQTYPNVSRVMAKPLECIIQVSKGNDSNWDPYLAVRAADEHVCALLNGKYLTLTKGKVYLPIALETPTAQLFDSTIEDVREAKAIYRVTLSP